MGRRWPLVVVLSLSLARVFVSAPAQAEDLPQLAHTTVITGSEAAGIRVKLPTETRFGDPAAGQASIKVEGEGSFVGFALVAEAVPERDGFVFLGGRLPKSAGKRYFVEVGGDWFSIGSGKYFSLDPGEYTLYLLPGTGRATVTLRFEDLQGRTELSPSRGVEFDLKSGKRRFDLPTDNYYAAGATGTLGGRGLVFGATWFETVVHGVTKAKTCFWRNEPRDPDAYGPTCGDMEVFEPGNSWNSHEVIDYGADPNPGFKLYVGSWHPFSSGFKRPGLKYGVSQVVQTASMIDKVDSLSFWLTYL